MARSPALLFGLLTAAGIVIGLTVLVRPPWQTASEEEVKAWLDPIFLETDTPDPAAQARFETLRSEWQGLPKGKSSNTVLERVPSPPKAAFAEKLWQLSRLGRVQRPPHAPSPSCGELGRASVGLAYDGDRLAKAGNSDIAGRRFAAALWMADQSAITATDLSDYTSVSEAAVRGFDKYFSRALPRLAEVDLSRLAALLPPASREAPLLRRALRLQLQQDLIPLLPDPYAWARVKSPHDPPEETLDAVLIGEMTDKLHQGRETYNAEVTVRNFNRAFVPLLENAMRIPSDYDLSGAQFTRDLAQFIPVSGAAGKTGFERTKAEFLYRLALRQTRNSYGDRLLNIWGNLLPSIQEGSNQTITIRESLRTRIALHRYQRKFGRPAPSLDVLLQKKLIATLPIDGFADGPMRYDPVRKRLWSVGRDLRDNGGTTKGFGQLFQADYVWETP